VWMPARPSTGDGRAVAIAWLELAQVRSRRPARRRGRPLARSSPLPLDVRRVPVRARRTGGSIVSPPRRGGGSVVLSHRFVRISAEPRPEARDPWRPGGPPKHAPAPPPTTEGGTGTPDLDGLSTASWQGGLV